MASEACNSVYKDGRKVLAQCNKLQTRLEAAALKVSQSRARQGMTSSVTSLEVYFQYLSLFRIPFKIGPNGLSQFKQVFRKQFLDVKESHEVT